MKLFLASSANKTLPLLRTVLPEIGKKVLFIANAADPYSGNTWWVDLDREVFKKLSYILTEADLRETPPEQFAQLLEGVDILHICGGSVYYLVFLLREKGFEKIITEAIKNNRVVYSGTSAGSIIVSENIKPFSYDQEEIEHIRKVPNHKGLGIIDFGIVPHCNSADWIDEHKKIIEQMPFDPEPLFFLQDTQAIWVEDDHMKLLKT